MRRFFPDLDRMQLVEEVDVVVPANWKVIMDNSIEGYHFDLLRAGPQASREPHRLQAIPPEGSRQMVDLYGAAEAGR